MKIKRGSTSVRRLVFIADTSSTTGAGLANLVYNSSGLVAYYFAGDLNNEVQISLVTATLGTFASGGFVAVDNTNMPGWYEIGIPDAALDGGNEVAIQLRGATNMAPVNIYIELDAVDYQSATNFGLTKFADIETDTQDIQSRLPAALVGGRMASNAEVVGDKTGYSLTQAFPSNFASLGINASGHVSRVVLVDTTTTNTDMRGTDGAALASAWTATRAGYLDGVLIAANYNQRTVSVTGSNHVAADIHELQPAVIDSTHFAANWFTASGLATDAVAEIADGVWDEAISGHLTAGTTGKTLSDSGSAGNPWTTDLATGYSGTQAGNILNAVKSQTDLIQAGGTVTVSTPVTATGQITTPLIIGDDYLNDNGRAFSWTVPLPSGYVIATASCKFGMRFEDSEGVNSFIATGTLIDAGSGNVTLRFDVPRTTTGELRPGWYDWSVEIVSASGTEITRVKSGKNAEWQAKQT